MSIEQARFNMIEQQIRPWDVLDFSVLEVMKSIPRENFVPSAYRSFAFMDTEIPLGHGETMMHPRVEGRILQDLAIQPADNCLEIGTGSGFLTACMASLANHVDSVEIHEDLSIAAQNSLDTLGVGNVNLIVDDATKDFNRRHKLYDVIVVTASMPTYDDKYERMLNIGGRMLVFVGVDNMQATLITRESSNKTSRVSLFETNVKVLCGAEKKVAAFSF